MLASIESFHQRLPGATFKLASGVDEHHGMLRFRWTMFGADGRPQVEGFDIGELDPAGRLKRITGFFGPFPLTSRRVGPPVRRSAGAIGAVSAARCSADALVCRTVAHE